MIRDGKFNSFIKNLLRHGSYKWSERTKALGQARIARGLYKCAICGIDRFKRQEVQLDHIDPVVSVENGFTTWDDYINRLFCPAEGFQVICTQCHDNKTKIEDEMRSFHKNEKKK